MASTATADEAYLIVATAVDQAFYRTINPELDRPGFDPIRHYLEHGWREGRDPAPWFSVRRYLDKHPDVAAAGENPFVHYLRDGVREARDIFASDKALAFRRAGVDSDWSYEPASPPSRPSRKAVAELGVEAPPADDGDRQVVAAEFDAGFYLETNPDVAASGVDPLEHFMLHGWREGRDPTPGFCVRDYLQDNPDVEQAGVNPFLHYILAGRAEGRAPRNRLGFRYQIIAGLTPLEERIAQAAARALTVAAESSAAWDEAVAASRTGLRDLHITFSHDDYTANVGGVQLCLQYESAAVAGRGRDHLHLCPATPWPVLRRGEAGLLTVILNGRAVGAFEAHFVAEALAKRDATDGERSFAIHNLLGHQVDEVLAILAAAKLERGFFWLHDFTSLCAGYQLLRNDVQDCGAPPPDSPACSVCLYGPGRMPQVAEHERLFAALQLTVVSPSQVTLDFWRRSWSYPSAAEVVHPHVTLIPREAAVLPDRGPLRVAFIGMPSAHKGWPIFAELATEFAADSRYRFLHLGTRRDPRAPVEFHPVSVSLADPAAMQRAVEELQVDVAVIWSIFRETFCLAAYEAVAGGAALVAGADSANAAAFAQSGDHGLVLPDEAALREALASGELERLARRERRPQLYDLAYGAITADLIDTGVAA